MIPHDALTLVGIDPGSRSLGTALLTFQNTSLIDLKIETLHYDKLKYSYPEHYQNATPSERILVLTDTLYRRLKNRKINSAFIESPFINPGRISAFKPLVELNREIVAVLIKNFGRNLPITFLAPVSVKKQMMTDKLDKASMKEALFKNEQLVGFEPVLKLADEHGLDATAVALAGFKLYR